MCVSECTRMRMMMLQVFCKRRCVSVVYSVVCECVCVSWFSLYFFLCTCMFLCERANIRVSSSRHASLTWPTLRRQRETIQHVMSSRSGELSDTERTGASQRSLPILFSKEDLATKTKQVQIINKKQLKTGC